MKVETVFQHEVITVDRQATIGEAAQTMRERHVGDLIVVEQRRAGTTPVGIITDRDIVVEVVGQGINPEQIVVGSVMSGDLVTAQAGDEVTDTLRAMSAKGVRRVPIVDQQGRLQGIVSVDDLVVVIATELMRLARLIHREQARELNKTTDPFQDEFAT